MKIDFKAITFLDRKYIQASSDMILVTLSFIRVVGMKIVSEHSVNRGYKQKSSPIKLERTFLVTSEGFKPATS